MDGVLGYSQEILMVIFEIAGLVSQKGEGYVVRKDEWVAMFSEYNLTNEISRTQQVGVFNCKPTNYVRIGRQEPHLSLKDQLKISTPPRTSKMKISRIMSGTVSQILIDLKSRKDVFCGVDLFKGVEDGMENYEVEDGEIEGMVEEVNNDLLEDSVIEIDDVNILEDQPEWMTKSNTINPILFPLLCRFGSTISDVELSTLLSELVRFTKDLETGMNFTYKNGRKGLLLEIPMNISTKYRNFQKYSGRTKWFQKLLNHIGGGNDEESTNEGAYLVSRHLCKEYETSMLLALKEHGMPVLEKMDKVTAGAMWSDAQVTLYQRRKILKYMRYSFGSKVMIPETNIQNMGSGYVKPDFGIYYFRKGTTVKPEKCQYWTRCLPDLLLLSTKHLLEESGKRSEISSACKNHNLPLSPFVTGRNKLGWELIVGADHGKGSWRSVIKVYHTDYTFRRAQEDARKICWTDRRMEDERGYFLLRNGHIDCKKDNEEILRNTVMPNMREDFTKIMNSRMVGLAVDSQFEVMLVPKHSKNIRVVSKESKSYVSYEIVDKEQNLVTDMIEETSLPCGANLCLDIPHFEIYITGDLAYYSDILGKPNSSPHWCHLCDTSHSEWNNVSNKNVGNLWSTKLLKETFEKYKQQTAANKKAIKGVCNELHYPDVSPQHYICPPLHICIGLLNKVWTVMMDWINLDIENIEEAEMNERKLLSNANILLDKALKTREEISNTTSIVLKYEKVRRREISKNIKLITDLVTLQDLQSHLSETDAKITDLNSLVQSSKNTVERLKKATKVHKDNISKLRKNRGWNVDSVVFHIECILKTFNVEAEAYHGGQFNGVSCRKILDNIESIMRKTEKVVISERKKPSETSDKEVLAKLKSYEILLKMLDATLSQMNIVNPTEVEIHEFENRKNEMMKLWRKLNISITTKAHLLEHHVHQQLK